jgi:hypothetical protein
MRKTTQLSPNTKNQLKDLQHSLKLKNESQVVSYLIAMYGQRFPKMTIVEHQIYMEQMTQIEGQGSL